MLRPFSTLTLSMRIPPTVQPDRAGAVLKDVLEADPPLGMKVTYKLKKAGTGWDAPALAKWLELSAEKASKKAYGKSACYLGEGGSIPFMGMLGKMFPEAQVRHLQSSKGTDYTAIDRICCWLPGCLSRNSS